jgi:hypothetical protein
MKTKHVSVEALREKAAAGKAGEASQIEPTDRPSKGAEPADDTQPQRQDTREHPEAAETRPMWPLEAGEMKRYAVISECGRFRYRLWRKWGCGSPLLFVMLNPSTADATIDDATIRRCLRFAEAHNFGELEVVNLFAYRATDPLALRHAGYPVGPDNDDHIREAARDSAAVCVAWGAHATGLVRPREVLDLLRAIVHPTRLYCLRTTRSGYPQHPLMLPSSCRLVPFTGNPY